MVDFAVGNLLDQNRGTEYFHDIVQYKPVAILGS